LFVILILFIICIKNKNNFSRFFFVISNKIYYIN
jgi:hypothetical protein